MDPLRRSPRTAARRSPETLALSEAEEDELIRAWLERGDRRARDRVVAARLGFVTRLAHRYRQSGCPLADLVQEGTLGLLHAIDKFDPDRGVRLSTYAGWWVRAFILRYVERNTTLVRGATTTNKLRLFYNLSRIKQRLSVEGEEPSAEAIAQALGVTPAEVSEMEALRYPVASLDAGRSSEGDGAAIDHVCDGGDDPAAAFEATEFRARIDEALDRFAQTLGGRHLEAFRDRVTSSEPVSLQELSRRWGTSREGVRKIERRVTTPLRRFLYQELGDTVTAALGGA